MLKDLVVFGQRSSNANDSGIVAETTLGGWLRQVAGYQDISKAMLKPKSYPGRRDWIEVAHAETGETCVFHCSERAGHTAATVKQRGASLRLICKTVSAGGNWWFTSEEGEGVEAGASFTLGGASTEATSGEAAMTEPVL